MFTKPLIYLLLSPILINSAEVENADPCAIISKKLVVSYQDTMSCLNMIKLTPEIKNSVYDTINKTLSFYVFIDIAERSPEFKIPSNVNIRKELAKVVSKPYKSENEYHNSITKFITSLYDGHLRYKSNCATMFEFKQPFPVFTEENQWGEIKVKVLEKLEYSKELIEAWKLVGVEVAKYAGKEIVTIDGLQPLEYLQEYSKEYIGFSRDVNARINSATARVIQENGNWGINYGAFASTNIPPKKENITFTFIVDGQEQRITVPYIVLVPQNYDLSMDFMKSFCYVQHTAKTSQPENLKLNNNDLNNIKGLKIDQSIDLEVIRGSNLPLSPLFDGIYIKSYLIHGKVGVVTIPDFSPNDVKLWDVEIRGAFQSLKDNKAGKLILELTNNGGGQICYPYNILDYLFPNAQINRFSADIHYDPLFFEVLKGLDSAGFDIKKDIMQPDGSPIDNIDYFKEPKIYNRGLNKNSKYTNLIQDKCSENPLKSLLDNNSQPFKAEDIIILSNSVCYSGCAFLANGLQEIHGVKGYSIGGLKYQEATVGSMAGGLRTPFQLVEFGVKLSGLSNHPDIPKPFKTNSEFSFTSREVYSTKFKGLRPLEFTWIPADKRLSYNSKTAFNPFKVWEQVSLDAFGI